MPIYIIAAGLSASINSMYLLVQGGWKQEISEMTTCDSDLSGRCN